MTIKEQNRLNGCQNAEDVRRAKALHLLKGEGLLNEEFTEEGVFLCHPYISVRDEFGHTRQFRPYYDHEDDWPFATTEAPKRGQYQSSYPQRMPLGDAIQWITQSRRRRTAEHGRRYDTVEPSYRRLRSA